MAENREKTAGSISLKRYREEVAKTDRFSNTELTPILLGLYGEVGSVMAASKKFRREKKAYAGYRESVEEEFGDALWYFSALCRRLDITLEDVFGSAIALSSVDTIAGNADAASPISHIISVSDLDTLDNALIELGSQAAKLLKLDKRTKEPHPELVQFCLLYLQAIQSTGLAFSDIVQGNLQKTLGRFLKPELELLPDFDSSFPEEEQLPRKFEIHIAQRQSGKCYLRWNGVFIGEPLTDSILDLDGYRFHDVFHFAHAAILHWSPTFRALIKQKRKSVPKIDEAQDGGRAIVVEEGLTAWLFSYSKGLEYFEGHDGVSFDILKTIQKFVHGYEVERCPLKLWEDAILQGYDVFRKVKENNGGIVIGDRTKRTLQYQSPGEK